MSHYLLPDNFEQTKKKARKKKEKMVPPPPPEPRDWGGGAGPPFLATITGHYTCDRCGTDFLDVSDIVRAGGKTQWKLICGTNCLHSWLVDPIPGVIDDADRKQRDFVVKGGRHSGKTFDQIAAEGNRDYIESLAKIGKREVLVEEAKKWLTRNQVRI